MKRIILNESQYKRLFEMNPTPAGLGDPEQNSIKPGIGSEVYTTAKGDDDENGVFDFNQPGVLGDDPRAEDFAPYDSPFSRRNI